MEQELKCNQVGILSGGKWDKLHDTNRRVYASDGLSPTLTTMGGGQREVKIIVPEATKKGYDEAECGDSINVAFPNSKTRCGRVGHGVAQTITATNMEQVVIEPIIYDDYNGRIRANQDCIGTLTTNCGNDALRNGVKIIEPVIVDEIYKNRGARIYSDHCPTIRAERQSLEVIEPLALDEQNGYIMQDGCVGTLTTDGSSPKHNNRIIEPRIAAMRGRNPDNPSDRTAGSPTEQRLEIGSEETSNTLTTVQKDNLVVEPIIVGGIGEHDFGKQNRQGNRVYSSEGVSCALTAQPLGNAGGYSYLYQETTYRIRKLTERECFRLMGVKEEDFERVAKNQSTSSLYHLAGDSIVTTCLMSIFGELFDCNYQEKINLLVKEVYGE